MAARYLNVPVGDLLVTRITGDASTRSYYRAQAGEASVVIALYTEPFDEAERAGDRLTKLVSENPAAKLTFANDPCAHIEVTALFLEAGLPVPAVLAVSGGDGAILIEDVGDTKMQDWLAGRAEAEAVEAYRRALRMVVRIQEASDLAVSSGSICSQLAFDEMKLKWELGFFFANYFNRYLGLRLDPATANAVQADFKAICSELAARPRVLTHRDYHTRNLMVREDDMYIIDYQDARMGPVSYDVASLLSDPYAGLNREAAGELVEYFIELKASSSMPLGDAEDFRRELELMTVQRMLKAVGTYSYQAAAMNNTVYVAYIEPALEAALSSMGSLGRFDRLRALLEETKASGSAN